MKIETTFDRMEEKMLNAAAGAAAEYLAPLGFSGRDIDRVLGTAEDAMGSFVCDFGAECINEVLDAGTVGVFYGYGAAHWMVRAVADARDAEAVEALPRFGGGELSELERLVAAAWREAKTR